MTMQMSRFIDYLFQITRIKKGNEFMTKSKLGFNIPFNSQGHIGTGPQHCHLWDSNPQR